jgi:hypothetical protein
LNTIDNLKDENDKLKRELKLQEKELKLLHKADDLGVVVESMTEMADDEEGEREREVDRNINDNKGNEDDDE